MYSLNKLKDLLNSEKIEYKEEFKKSHKCITLVSKRNTEVTDTQMKRVIDFCNKNALFYALDINSKFYIY